MMKSLLEHSGSSAVHPLTAWRQTGAPACGREIPLSALRAGERGVVSRLRGDEGFRGKMLSLGIFPGTEVMVAGGGEHQPAIVQVGPCRVMMDCQSTGQIYIKTTPGQQRKERGRWRRRFGSRT